MGLNPKKTAILMDGELDEVYMCEHCGDIHFLSTTEEVIPAFAILTSVSPDKLAKDLMQFPQFRFEVQELLKNDPDPTLTRKEPT